MDINQAKDIVINAGKELVAQGLIARTWGNVSQKVDDNTMVITPSGKDYLSLTREDIVTVNIHTLEYEGSVKPSSEKGIHASCYKNKNVNFVIHTHQEYASIISGCGIAYLDTYEEYSLLNGKVICAPYGLPSTKKLSDGIADVLPLVKGNCIIMKNHGALCFGKDFEETFEAANQLEAACIGYLDKKYCEVAQVCECDEESVAKYILSKHVIIAESLKPKKLNCANANDYAINSSPEAVAFSYLNISLKPMVDDFAQIIGVKMQVVNNNQNDIEKGLKKADAVFVKGVGAVCSGNDAEAVCMIVEKNSKAFMWAMLHGKVKPINSMECRLMRTVFKLKYSKEKDRK